MPNIWMGLINQTSYSDPPLTEVAALLDATVIVLPADLRAHPGIDNPGAFDVVF